MNFINRYLVKSLFVLVGLLVLQVGVQAHTNEYLDSVDGTHGGTLRTSGPYHLELIVDQGEVIVWVMDHNNEPKPTDGARGQLILFQDDERIVLDLEPDGESAMRGADERISASQSPRATLTLSMRGQPPLQVRFAKIDKPSARKNDHAH